MSCFTERAAGLSVRTPYLDMAGDLKSATGVRHGTGNVCHQLWTVRDNVSLFFVRESRDFKEIPPCLFMEYSLLNRRPDLRWGVETI